MELQKAISVLERFNEWRLGAEISPPNPRQITEALEIAIHLLKPMAKK